MGNVVEMKQRRWSVPGVDFTQVIVGNLQLLPDDAERFAAIAGDHQTAVEGECSFVSLTDLLRLLTAFAMLRIISIVLCVVHRYKLFLLIDPQPYDISLLNNIVSCLYSSPFAVSFYDLSSSFMLTAFADS